MIGQVNLHYEAILPIRVRGPRSHEEQIDAVLDTGFSGSLTLPPWIVTKLGLPFRRRGRALLADGSQIVFDIHEAIVLWNGRPRRISVDVADVTPLIGMGLLRGYHLSVDIIIGGRVEITVVNP